LPCVVARVSVLRLALVASQKSTYRTYMYSPPPLLKTFYKKTRPPPHPKSRKIPANLEDNVKKYLTGFYSITAPPKNVN
jgi:hypothetical protein